VISVPYNFNEVDEDESESDEEDDDEIEDDFDEELKKEMTPVNNKQKLNIRFLDAMNFVVPMPLKEFVTTFTDEKITELDQKIDLPYEAYDITNYMEVLNKGEPFTKDDSYNSMTKKCISDE
jgi:hypothetical protein